MPAPESAIIVARFLRANHYNETLEAFLKEAGLPDDAGSLGPGQWTIEQILQEKREFDKSLAFERQGDNGSHGWSEGAPKQSREPQIDITTNVLCVSGSSQHNTISVTSADRSWNDISGSPPYRNMTNASHTNDSPILSIKPVENGLVLSTSMSGHLALRQVRTHAIVDQCRHHSKYAVAVTSMQRDDLWVVATAGWDQKIYFYAPDVERVRNVSASESGLSLAPGALGEPIHSQSLPSNPESIILVQHPDTYDIYLIASRRDSTHLYYYRIERTSGGRNYSVHEAGRQNLAPHSNAWVAFTACSLSPCPTDPTLVAVATSHLPHMKLIVVRLLFPGTSAGQFTTADLQTQASVARAELALQDKEDAAIKLHVTTFAPQTPYSTPQVVWRPDGSGLFINGDDGVIRGIEATTGKIVTMLKGHEAGTKVRTLWAGKLKNGDNAPEEVLVSGGFDKKLIIWTA